MSLFLLLTIHLLFCFFFFKQKTAYEMRISDWSSDVCSSDLTVTLKIKFADFEQITRSKTPGKAVDNRMMLTGIYEELLDSIMPLERPLRLLGLTISNLIDPTEQPHVAQLSLEL